MTIPPLLILAIGIAIVLGMIIAMRINAFIALITAAIVVSLLAPGDVGEKISRVASAFGRYAGSIGIVIALAAVIGKCMMDSGAADRIVRAFLRVLGEKRSSTALMGSGFVLAVPVFFDTVFYLLVPLARSLYRKTKKNYLTYVLAIAAGGAITHTLVPPTPGPLIMAANLSIDLGTMIMVGGLVALPAAFAGILFARTADKLMPIEMRSIGSVPDPEPLDDSQLPSLTLSLLPVILPVLMISANTILTTLADNQRSARLSTDDIEQWNFAGSDDPVAVRLRKLSADDPAIDDIGTTTPSTDDAKQRHVASLNGLLARKDLYDAEAFQQHLPPSDLIAKRLASEGVADDAAARLRRAQTARSLLGTDLGRLKKAELERLNRLLLEVAFPAAIDPHEWNTGLRKAANVSNLFGNANLALLISAAVAMLVYFQKRKPTLTEFGESVESSLMSGGAIILITAAGGAFGAMLAVAQVGPAIRDLFAGGAGTGMFYLFFGFGVAALLKIAQGSSTTAMIVGSSMIAPSIATIDLGFNAVYIATAIGAGSLVGSWMNDSGFWIFCKMSGLTEVESLKSWTPLLIVLAIVAMGTTLLLATVLPLV